MFLIVIFNVLFIWLHPVNSVYYNTFVSNKVRLLNDGNRILTPAFGTATYTVNEIDYTITQSVYWAIESGFRHVDTAAYYANEDLVGQGINNAISSGIVKREDLYVTTKLPLDVVSSKKVVRALELSLKRLQLDYVDLYLIHFPYSVFGKKKFDLLDIWYGMEEAKKLGLTKSIGVANFEKEDFDFILPYCTTLPAVNQIEVNPTFTNTELVEYCQDQGIIVMAYGPLGYTVPRPWARNNRPPPSLNDPVLVKMADKYGVTTSQVTLRYLMDRGLIPIPRSTNKKHIQLNIDLFNFSLTDEEVEKISSFNINRAVYAVTPSIIAEDYKMRMEHANERNRKLYPL